MGSCSQWNTTLSWGNRSFRKLNRLNKRFVLLSNAPRPSKNVEKFLLNLKMDKIFVKTVFTSGEAALKV